MIVVACSTLVATVGAQVEKRPVTGVVTGVVRSRVTGDAIRLAVVRASPSNASTLSDDGGRYRLELPVGDHRLEP